MRFDQRRQKMIEPMLVEFSRTPDAGRADLVRRQLADLRAHVAAEHGFDDRTRTPGWGTELLSLDRISLWELFDWHVMKHAVWSDPVPTVLKSIGRVLGGLILLALFALAFFAFATGFTFRFGGPASSDPCAHSGGQSDTGCP